MKRVIIALLVLVSMFSFVSCKDEPEPPKSYVVTFDKNGHGTAPGSQTIQEGQKVTEPDALTAVGIVFGGWYKEAGCTNAWNFASDVVTADITLYAKWTAHVHSFENDICTDCGASKCTDTIGYKIENGVITLTGTGAMPDYSKGFDAPWNTADMRNAITSIVIGDGITTIGKNAFYSFSNASSVTLGNSIVSIGEYTFGYCYKLQTINLPETLTSIKSNAFRDCDKLQIINLPETLTSIESTAFRGTGVKEIVLPSMTTKVAEYSFYEAKSLSSITLNEGLTTIEKYAFHDTAITTLNIPSTVTSIDVFGTINGLETINVAEGNTVFKSDNGVLYQESGSEKILKYYPCKKTSVVIEEGTTQLGSGAFFGWSGTTIEVPEGVTKIDSNAFRECKSLTSATIPSTVTSIGKWLFMDCSELISCTFEGTVPPTLDYNDSGLFDRAYKLQSIYVPDESIEAYKSTFGAKETPQLTNKIKGISQKP